MISVEQARERILAGLRPTAAEIVPLASAWGRVCAAAMASRLTQPPRDVSAMDGYALRAADGTLGARLRVAGSAPAGHPWDGTLGAGEALRIFTGSIIPDGADAILLQEDATRDGDGVTVNEAVTAGRHIRRAGQDFATGDVLVPAGKRLGARDIGLIAAGNHPWVAVHRQPRVAILATGDEIALPGEPIPPGGIVSSNSHALAALVRAGGGDPVVLPVAPDDRDAIAAAADAAAGADILVTTGGASVGEHDLVQDALAARGMTLDFWKIAMRPGKPLMHGTLGGVPMLGLPGNPVSSLVTAILFLLPAIARLSGLPGAPPAVTHAGLGAALAANDHRADHLRARLEPGADGALVATAFERQDSAMLRLLTLADALILRPPHAPAAPAGATVPIIRLDTLGI
ncbi:molybdopterin molybdotransferase MoeA [Limobrevibacterium gyesilva]|uniref:Molybdopterin molybdenumtransferase n=1 Tax=Limobrevibacterium gyesilva TaxID=2991712 RepID=A0AA41YHW0_9PROT|nr:gephyrin-like molybdotransferase Glp [Limobrevibacterium gyesilva]MCW3473736.1 molybdopterin molybdotransferase MoeA [Limobrevibacterium gyesilva]